MGEIIDKLKGKAKQIEGDLTNDSARHTEGVIDEKKGEVKGKFEELKQNVKDTFRK